MSGPRGEQWRLRPSIAKKATSTQSRAHTKDMSHSSHARRRRSTMPKATAMSAAAILTGVALCRCSTLELGELCALIAGLVQLVKVLTTEFRMAAASRDGNGEQ
jgi:hypothetical protein